MQMKDQEDSTVGVLEKEPSQDQKKPTGERAAVGNNEGKGRGDSDTVASAAGAVAGVTGDVAAGVNGDGETRVDGGLAGDAVDGEERVLLEEVGRGVSGDGAQVVDNEAGGAGNGDVVPSVDSEVEEGAKKKRGKRRNKNRKKDGRVSPPPGVPLK